MLKIIKTTEVDHIYYVIASLSIAYVLYVSLHEYFYVVNSKSIDLLYFGFLVLGFVGSILALIKIFLARWLLIVFYVLQIPILYKNGHRYSFDPGFSVHFSIMKGNIQQSLTHPEGFGINMLAAGMAILCYLWLRPVSEQKSIFKSIDIIDNEASIMEKLTQKLGREPTKDEIDQAKWNGLD